MHVFRRRKTRNHVIHQILVCIISKAATVGSFEKDSRSKVLTEGGSFIKFDEVFLPVIDVQPLADVSRSQD